MVFIQMFDGLKMSEIQPTGWKAVVQRLFYNAANDRDHVEPFFNEAAGGEDEGGGVKPVEFHTGVLPGIRDAMIGDNIANRVLHDTRKASANFRSENLRTVHIS